MTTYSNIAVAESFSTSRVGKLPHDLPNIFAAFKIAITQAVVGSIVAEFVGTDRGLGCVLMSASGNLDTTFLFADLARVIVEVANPTSTTPATTFIALSTRCHESSGCRRARASDRRMGGCATD
jgi:hypothetical protein